jgi:hypothetical protein
MKTIGCNHNWVMDIEHSDDVAYQNCYNVDGPSISIYICTKCGMKKEISNESKLFWYEYFLMILLIPLLMVYFGIIFPIMFVIGIIFNTIEDLRSD